VLKELILGAVMGLVGKKVSVSFLCNQKLTPTRTIIALIDERKIDQGAVQALKDIRI
jgi:hypothetical protein